MSNKMGTEECMRLHDEVYGTGEPPVQTRRDLYRQLQCAQTILDSVGDALLVANNEQRVLLCNETAQVLFGPGLLEMTPGAWRTRYRFMLPDDALPASEETLPIFRALRGETLTRQIMQISGTGLREVWVSITARPVHEESGRFEWTYIVARDMNLRVWSEESLRLRDRAMASSTEGIVITDAHRPGKPIIYVNEGFLRLTGYTREEVLGKEGKFLYGAALESDEVSQARSALRAEHPVALEIRNYRKDGSPYWIRLSVTPVHDASGKLTHYISVLSDVTELIETEQRLKETTRQLQEANQQLTWAHNRMKQNLDAAAKVQQALLPSALPEMEGLDFASAFQPDEELSGDLLNVVQLDKEHVALYLLDVTGHGVASAMLSVAVSRLLMPVRSATALVYEHTTGSYDHRIAAPWKVATRLAMRFKWDLEANQFFTFVYAVLNRRTGEFRYVSAGHPPPIYVHSQGERFMEQTKGLPIGIGQEEYKESSIQLEPGSRVWLYSDGVTEAMNLRKELFGEQRLMDSLRETRDLPLQASVDALVARIEAWREGGAVSDDVSVLAVELTG
jgi:phosphoserine phosphatase RsbU/P